MQTLKQFLNSITTRLLADVSCEGVACLIRPAAHPPLLTRRRAEMIISRVRLVAALFAVLTPLWIIVDVWVFATPLSIMLAVGRVVTSLAFGALALSYGKSVQMGDAYRALAIMFAIPTVFFIYSHLLLSHFQSEGAAAVIAAGYAFLPFVMVAGLSMFPLTALEGILFAIPVLLSEALVALMQLNHMNWSTHLGAFWLMLLIAATATLAGMSQLAFMVALVHQATHDPLTRCFSRASGDELLNLQFSQADRNGSPLAVVFADLDKFKLVNDGYGHEAGDLVLIAAVEAIRKTLRGGDALLRWGGEEFLIILPNTNCAEASAMLDRVRANGLGLRPDGSALTASYGIAERLVDCAKDWQHLVEIADQRMYQAKEGGRDRWVGCGEPEARG